MRVSDIETIRGDRDAQKPFVAYGAVTTLDPAEPYGGETKAVSMMEVTVDEKELLINVLNERLKDLKNRFSQNPKPLTRNKLERMQATAFGLMDKLKR